MPSLVPFKNTVEHIVSNSDVIFIGMKGKSLLKNKETPPPQRLVQSFLKGGYWYWGICELLLGFR